MRILLIGLLMTATQTGASATGEDPFPTDVMVAWATPANDTVKVSWREVGSLPNHIVVLLPDGTPMFATRYTSASDPNEVLIRNHDFPRDTIPRVAVYVGTPEGGDTSQPGLSPVFDTQLAPAPVIDDVAPGPGESVRIRWHGGTPIADPVPGDPLDLPQSPRYQVLASDPMLNLWHDVGTASPATEFVLRNWGKPHRLEVLSVNEWGGNREGRAGVDISQLTSRVPAASSYGAVAAVRGLVSRLRQICDIGLCTGEGGPDDDRLVVLQAWTGTAWASVTTGRTDPHGRYLLTYTAIGTRRYRVVAVNEHGPDVAVFGVASAPALSVTRARLLSARFLDPTVQYGHRATAYMKVCPALTARALLQRWNGARWVGVAYLPVRRGAGSVSIAAVPRGTVGYRLVLPTSTYAGLPINGLVTRPFFLTAR